MCACMTVVCSIDFLSYLDSASFIGLLSGLMKAAFWSLCRSSWLVDIIYYLIRSGCMCALLLSGHGPMMSGGYCLIRRCGLILTVVGTYALGGMAHQCPFIDSLWNDWRSSYLSSFLWFGHGISWPAPAEFDSIVDSCHEPSDQTY